MEDTLVSKSSILGCVGSSPTSPPFFSGPKEFRQGAELGIGVGGVVPARRDKTTSANNTVHYDYASTAQVAAA